MGDIENGGKKKVVKKWLTQLSQLCINIGIYDSVGTVSFHHSPNRVVDCVTPLAAAVSANPS